MLHAEALIKDAAIENCADARVETETRLRARGERRSSPAEVECRHRPDRLPLPAREGFRNAIARVPTMLSSVATAEVPSSIRRADRVVGLLSARDSVPADRQPAPRSPHLVRRGDMLSQAERHRESSALRATRRRWPARTGKKHASPRRRTKALPRRSRTANRSRARIHPGCELLAGLDVDRSPKKPAEGFFARIGRMIGLSSAPAA